MRSFLLSEKKPLTPEEYEAEKLRMASSMPTDVGSGVAKVAEALMLRNRQFPSAPGGGSPGSFLNGLFRKQAGLY